MDLDIVVRKSIDELLGFGLDGYTLSCS
ncbi:hypothetical protein [Streptococcus pneumoniae]|nr:hypothetical protein [Streptococcus pneumoniae]